MRNCCDFPAWDNRRSHKPDSNQDPVYYLHKRLFMDGDVNNADSFFIYTMKKRDWRQFQRKVKCQWNVFSLANDPVWTLNKGPWWRVSMTVSKTTVNSFRETVPKSLTDASPKATSISEA